MNTDSDVRSMGRAWMRKPWVWAVAGIAALIVAGIGVLLPAQDHQPMWSMQQVAEAAKARQISQVRIADDDLMTITLVDGRTVYATKAPTSTAMEHLEALGVETDQLAAIAWQNDKSVNWQALVTLGIYIAAPLVALAVLIIIVLLLVRGRPAARQSH